MAGYKAACPNQTFCADRHLARVAFMHPRDVGIFLLRVLGRAGLASSPTGRPEDVRLVPDSVAIVEQGRGPWHPEHSLWLRYTVRPDGVLHCWLAGKPRGRLAAPPGWKPEHSLEYVRLDPGVEGEPVESLDNVPPAPEGYITVYQGRAYSDDDSTQTASKRNGGRKWDKSG
jgi:hypothetical protein